MTNENFRKFMLRRLAQIAIGPSAIRKQGSSGLLNILRNYLELRLKIDDFGKALKDDATYQRFLNYHTLEIVKLFPEGAKSWGAARKGINLFLREVVYNSFYRDILDLSSNLTDFDHEIQHMEIPLDKEVANGLLNEADDGMLPKWKSIKSLDSYTHNLFQKEAIIIARRKETIRLHLDLIYWRRLQPDI